MASNVLKTIPSGRTSLGFTEIAGWNISGSPSYVQFFGPASEQQAVLALGPSYWYEPSIFVAEDLDFHNLGTAGAADAANTGATATTLNSRVAASYNGTDQFHSVTSGTIAQPFTVFLAFKNRAHTNSDEIFGGSDTADAFIRQGGSSGIIAIGANNSAGAGTVTVAAGTSAVITAVFNSTTSTLQKDNGTAQANSLAANGLTTSFYIGAGADSYGAVDVAACLVFTSALSAANRTIVHDYLARRYMNSNTYNYDEPVAWDSITSLLGDEGKKSPGPLYINTDTPGIAWGR